MDAPAASWQIEAMQCVRASETVVGGVRRPRAARARGQSVLLCAAMLAVHPATAVDLATATPPIEIVDHKLTSGPRTLWLPDGHWYLLETRQGSVSSGASGASVADTATFVQIEDDKFVLGGRLFILRADALAFGWNFSPCGNPEDIYVRDRNPNARQPDCLTVYSRRKGTPDSSAHSKSSKEVLDWMAQHNVDFPEYSVVVTYARYATNTFGVLSLRVPADRFDSETTAIAWSETLRSALKRFFEHREDEGHFPTLPAPAGEGASPAASTPPP
jgi:hypothetical protein